MKSPDHPDESDPVIVTGDHPRELVQVAAEELRRYFSQLFGIRIAVRETSGGARGPVVVLDPAEARRAKADLSDQGIILQGELTASGGRLLCSGGSPGATLWAVYELLDQLGVRFLLSGDIVPDEPRPFAIPPLAVVREPLLRVRAWRGMNVIAHSATMWGLAEYRRLIDQLAKLKFNLLYLVFRPGEPYFQFEFDGVRQQSAVLDFGHRYPIDERTIGRELFGGQNEFTNPELYGCATDQQRRERAMKLVREIIAYAHTRGLKVSVAFCFPEFLEEHKQRLVELSRAAGFVPEGSAGGYFINYAQWKEGADPRFAPYLRINNPAYLDLLEAYLRTWLTTYPEADYFQFGAMEFRGALPADADWAWQRLSERHQLPPGISLQGLRDQVRNRAGAEDQRAMMELEGDICTLDAWDVLWKDRNLRALLPDDRSVLLMGGLCAEVNRLFAEPPDKSLGVLQEYYRQLLSSLREAQERSLPQGRRYLAQYIEQCSFGIHWIDAVTGVREASVLRQQADAKASPLSPTQARTSADPFGYDRLRRQSVARLEQALASSRLALEAWARSVVDRSDLGALAALNEFGHRTIESILHQQRMEADHWSFLIPAKGPDDRVGVTRFDKRKIVHIRGVDHPESISVGPQGEAYTTGTGGQVYRIRLDTNTVEQFASTTPRRMLGQAVDADGNLYCADTSGKVIRVTPQGVESTYGLPPAGATFLTPNYPAFDRAGNLYLSDSGDWSDTANGRVFNSTIEDGSGLPVTVPTQSMYSTCDQNGSNCSWTTGVDDTCVVRLTSPLLAQNSTSCWWLRSTACAFTDWTRRECAG